MLGSDAGVILAAAKAMIGQDVNHEQNILNSGYYHKAADQFKAIITHDPTHQGQYWIKENRHPSNDQCNHMVQKTK